MVQNKKQRSYVRTYIAIGFLSRRSTQLVKQMLMPGHLCATTQSASQTLFPSIKEIMNSSSFCKYCLLKLAVREFVSQNSGKSIANLMLGYAFHWFATQMV